jgi:hypothetical protein
MTARKELGQFMTPAPVAELTAAVAISSPGLSVIDPMSGDGSMLRAATKRLKSLGDTRPRVQGIELDASLVELAQSHAASENMPSIEMRHGEAFTMVGQLNGASPIPVSGYDAVLGNPPYVRYQSLSQLIDYLPRDLVTAYRTARPAASDSQVVAFVIRSSLIAHLIKPTKRKPDEFVTQARELLRSPALASDPVEVSWTRLVASYSGLSDLTLPAWLLTWLLAKPSGSVAFITSDSLLNREYGRLLRYFMLRFLRPKFRIAQVAGTWFRNAQIAASLMVFDSREPKMIEIPLQQRNLDRELIVTVRVLDHRCLPEIAEAISEGRLREGRSRRWEIQFTTSGEWAESLFAEHFAGNRSSHSAKWLEHLEEPTKKPSSIRVLSTEAKLPAQISSVFDVPILDGSLCTLTSKGIVVNQGLRTGCNDFFYLKAQENHDGTGPAIRSSPLLNFKWDAFPTELIWPVVRSQRSISYRAIRSSELCNFALITGTLARPHDLRRLTAYPVSWRRFWTAEFGMGALPRSVIRFIDLAEQAMITSKGKAKRIPTLVAVAPNEQLPPASESRTQPPPPPPRWWYTLPIQPRHHAEVFVTRVNGITIEAYLNDLKQPALIDANFSTISCGRKVSPHALLAFLNSGWTRVALEFIGTRMGGGALKVEAAHLRLLPVPVQLDLSHRCRLADLGRELATKTRDTSAGLAAAIDATILGSLGVPRSRASGSISRLASLAEKLTRERERVTSI